MKMILTLEHILGNPKFVGAVIDRTAATKANEIQWTKLLDFQSTRDRVFKTHIGNSSAVRMGSVIDRYSGRPLRARKGLRQGILEVADLGDKMQMDIARLEEIDALLKSGTPDIEDVVNHLVDDYQEMYLAPHKRMDKVVYDLISTGEARVSELDNSKGVKVLDLSIKMIKVKTTSATKGELIPFLQKIHSQYKHLGLGVIEMSQETFFNRFATSEELRANYKAKLGESEVVSSGILTEKALSALFISMGLPAVSVIDSVVEDLNGNQHALFAKDRLTFRPAGKVGKMRWHSPYELSDRVPGKVYNELAGGHMIATSRTEEGRFISYSAEWVPEINSSRMLNVELAGLD